MESLPLTSSQVEAATRRDQVLSRVLHFTKNGWPMKYLDPSFKMYWNRIISGRKLPSMGIRVVIPVNCPPEMLEDPHREHAGMTRMKAIFRSCF
jgi:hypothetical protein